MTNSELAIQFFLQIAVILFICKLVGFVAAKFGQPQVVAEMIAGVMLGPSLFGYFFPLWQQAIFPWDPTQTQRDSQSYLYPASQLGLAIYMFIIGMEFRWDIIKIHLKTSIAVSVAGMVAPFLLGAGLAAYLYKHTDLFGAKTSLNESMLFLGASMCITAFPMLARIIQTKGLNNTLMGTVAIGAGAIDDVTAWCLLAFVLATFDGDMSHAVYAILGGAGFLAACLLIVKPLLFRCQALFLEKDETLSEIGLAVALACLALGAWFSDLIQLHAVFGSFVVGIAIPRGKIANELCAKIQPLAVTLLLPLFFTYSGLNTQITLLNTSFLWFISFLIFATAVVGKGVACTAAAKFAGLGTRDALGIGTLMNARGLMELIIINIGLQRGIITDRLFATLVIMAIFTTLMASPIFDFLMRTRNGPLDASGSDVSNLPTSKTNGPVARF